MEEALQLDPEFASAHRSLGVLLYNQGLRSDSMFFHMAEAVRLGNRLTDYERHHARAFQAITTYQLREAQREYELLLAMDSADHVALIDLGVVLEMFGTARTGGEALPADIRPGERALNTILWNLVQSNLGQGERVEATAFADTAAAIYPDHSTPIIKHWRIEMDRGDFVRARKLLQRLESEHGETCGSST